MIDLTELNNHVKTEIGIDLTIDFDQTELEESEILELRGVEVKGNITKNSNNDIILNLQANGTMKIEDAISLEPVDYPFHIELVDQLLENNEMSENSLDLKELLWQNIVLEIPLRYTVVEDLSEFQGTGWKLISEDELKDVNNPFNDLMSKLGEE